MAALALLPLLRRLTVVAALLPASGLALSVEDGRHLLGRTGFGATPEAIAALAGLDRAAAAERLLATTRRQALTPAPDWVEDPPPDPRTLRTLTEDQRRALQQQIRDQTLELRAWWYREMIATDSPLTERMVLFWHGHFTSGIRKVRWPALLYHQNAVLRQHALGNFRELLHAIARDPAMVIYLDSQTNRKGRPNENFARELLELFTLGPGHYTERDIREAARAFSGWMVDRRTGRFMFNARQHDDGVKEFMGHRGRFNGDDIIDILLEQPRTAEHITEKLWREFVGERLDAAEVRRIAAVFRSSGYALKPALAAVLKSDAFWAANYRATLVKSPAELMVGTARVLRAPLPDPLTLTRAGRQLGQSLFDPPNVKGWPGGTAWITSSTLLARQNFLNRSLRGAELGQLGEDYLNELRPLLAATAPVQPPAGDADALSAVRALMLDPTYQLK